jgi:iron complex outermembrane receptor protein
MTTWTLNRTLLATALMAALAPADAQQADAAPGAAPGLPGSPGPVATISRQALASTGMGELGKALQALSPSFSFSTIFLAGGSDIIRPGTLFGAGPDQVLVLVNGKRRHQHALVHINQTVGRGWAGTDFDAIPLSAIDHIDILGGDAVARYGSDATAGVIDIVLKKDTGGTALSAMAGTTAEGDGGTVAASASRGFAFGPGGYLDLSAEARRRGETNRAGIDMLATPPRVTQHIGDIRTRDVALWGNAALPTGGGDELYAFAGASRRTGDGYALFRYKDDPRNVPAVYPGGYVPELYMTVRDASLGVGYRRNLGNDWKVDLSLAHGHNQLRFRNRHSINVSYWYEPEGYGIYGASPTGADAGKLVLTQGTANLDFSGPVTLLGSRIDLSTGFEYRRDGYRIVAGEPVSYQFGRTDDPALWIADQTGDLAGPGMQGFQGYSPADAIGAARHSVAFYLDAQQKFGQYFTIGSGVRYERYSDVGLATAGNLVLRYQPSPSLSVNAGASTGFRAPGVQQRFYSSTVVDLDRKGAMTKTMTAREGSAAALALGFGPLAQEHTRTVNAGLVLRPADGFALSANAFRTVVLDRIVLSSPITKFSGYCSKLGFCSSAGILEALHTDQVQVFANAIDTATRGLELAAERTLRGHGATLVLTGQLGFNRTEVTARHARSPLVTADQLFRDDQVTLVEHGQPRQHHVLMADVSRGALGFNARANYYGAVQGQGYTAPYIQTWDAKWLLDLSVRYAVSRQLNLSAGVNNMFDTYPTRWDPMGAAPYPQMGFTWCRETCPFGINGRTLYARVDYTF